MHEVRCDARAGRAERVADGERASVHICSVARKAELFLDRQILRRERLQPSHIHHITELPITPFCTIVRFRINSNLYRRQYE